jgi:hypothetical protein
MKAYANDMTISASAEEVIEISRPGRIFSDLLKLV